MADEEEYSTAFQLPPIDSKKGQMMLIYLPEGAVMVDRGEMTSGNVPPQFSGQPIGATPSRSTGPVSRGRSQRRPLEHIVLRRRHKIDWVHTINVAFTSFVALTSILPWLVTAVFGISAFGVTTSVPALNVSRGDLVVAHVLSVDRVVAGDVLLLRDNNTWNLKIRQVTTKTSAGDTTTIATNSGVSTPTEDVLTLANATSVRYCSSYVPFFGYLVMIFASIALKTLVVVSVLILNVVVYFHRRRTRVVEEKLAFVAR